MRFFTSLKSPSLYCIFIFMVIYTSLFIESIQITKCNSFQKNVEIWYFIINYYYFLCNYNLSLNKDKTKLPK